MARRNARLTPVTRLELVREVEAGWSCRRRSPGAAGSLVRPSGSGCSASARRERTGSRTAPQPHPSTPGAPHPRWSGASAPCAAAQASGRTASPGRSGSPAPRSMPCSGAAASSGSTGCTASPARRSATSPPPPATCCTSTSRSWGASPRAAATAGAAAPVRPRAPAGPAWTTCTSPWTTTAATPTSPSCRDERGASCSAFLEQALTAFGRRGVRVRRVLTDNAKAYTVARSFRAAAAAAGVELRHTRPYRPQTNGKAERFIQILQNEWAYARPYRSNAERLRALPRWLYHYNHRRPHGGVGGVVPVSRLETTSVGSTARSAADPHERPPPPRCPGAGAASAAGARERATRPACCRSWSSVAIWPRSIRFSALQVRRLPRERRGVEGRPGAGAGTPRSARRPGRLGEGARPRTAPAKAVRRSQHAPADLTGHSHTRFCRATRAGTSPDSQPARPSPPTASMNDLSPNRGARRTREKPHRRRLQGVH